MQDQDQDQETTITKYTKGEKITALAELLLETVNDPNFQKDKDSIIEKTNAAEYKLKLQEKFAGHTDYIPEPQIKLIVILALMKLVIDPFFSDLSVSERLIMFMALSHIFRGVETND